MPKRTLLALCCLILSWTAHASDGVLRVYGPGGPAPAMQEAAAVFGQKTGIRVEIVAGPAEKWLPRARDDADLIFGGAEYMMSDFIAAAPDLIEARSVYPLFLRPAAMLVRPGNPKRIRRFEDLLKPGLRILVVNGAGQKGLWEDMAGRLGDIKSVRALRGNIVEFAPSGTAAEASWQKNPDLDVWITWNVWQKRKPARAELVPVEKRYAIYRDTGIALTKRAMSDDAAQRFYNYLKGREAAAFFNKRGWITHDTWQ